MSAAPTIVPVVLSGGSGTRLWPVSRRLYPKQFAPLVADRTMFQETVARLDGLGGIAEPLVVCNEDHGELAASQLAEIGVAAAHIVMEPQGRNTAPAAAVAALVAAESGGDPLLLILPADHVIEDVAAFHRGVTSGVPLASGGHLVTFGVVPDRPHTGYGYIQRGADLDGAFVVRRFVEKPDAATAADYLASGEYSWNSGMFLFRASRYLEELGHHAPGILAGATQSLEDAARVPPGLLLDEAAFAATPADSIDYAVMEHTERAAVVPLDAGWNDVGAWPALWEIADHDQSGNAIAGDVMLVDTTGSYVRAEHRLVSVVGLEDVVVVETADAVLIAARHRAQDVKAIVERLRDAGRPEAERHTDR
jgi:mannose-1-phosphate guanylyltransferase/mannose-1-phosphate guanylyltransferase/mannose-6-phosphate isomerase